jgi:hypothetical protein
MNESSEMNGFGCRIQQASESLKREDGGNFWYVSYSEPSNSASTTTLNLSRVLNATRQREKGLRNGKAEAPPVL